MGYGFDMKKIILLCLFWLLSFSVLAIEIRLDKEYCFPNEKDFREILGERFASRFASLPSIAWGKPGSLVFRTGSYCFILSIETGEYTSISELNARLGDDKVFMEPFEFNDFILFDYGSVFAGFESGVFCVENGWKEIIEPDLLPIRKVSGNQRMDGHENIPYWEKPLYGWYVLVPRPEITDFSERQLMDTQAAVSYKNRMKKSLFQLPIEFYSVRNIGSLDMTAVSFDRFKIAIISELIQETKESPLHFDDRIYILDVIYDGLATCETIMKVESPEQGERIEVLPENTKLLVTGTTTYEIMDNGTEDYWYRVTANGLEGIVFGGDLLIEGDDWTVRLKDRGRPIEWEDLDDYFEYLKQDSHDIQIKETSEIENENLKNELVVLDSIDLLEETSNSLPETLSFNAKKSNRLWLQAIGLIAVGIFLAIALILWERRKK